MTEIQLKNHELQRLLTEAARMGAQQAIADLTCYTKQQAADMLGLSVTTINARIREKKLRAVDGRIPGSEIRGYLSEHGRHR